MSFEFSEFLRKLSSDEQLYNGNGNPINSSLKRRVLGDITEGRSPLRSERLGYLFSKKYSKLYVTYHKFDSSGKLIKVTERLDPDTLLTNKTLEISLDDWVNNPNPQGLPKSNVQNGILYFWKPVENKVAWFYADADGANLDCDWDPLFSDAFIGVRVAKILEKALKDEPSY